MCLLVKHISSALLFCIFINEITVSLDLPKDRCQDN